MLGEERIPFAQNPDYEIQQPVPSKFQTVIVKFVIPIIIFILLFFLFGLTFTLFAFVIQGNANSQNEYNIFIVGDWVFIV